jgi:hypothetical protein
MAAANSSFIQKIQSLATVVGISARTLQSRTWYIKKLQGLRNLNRKNLLKDPAMRHDIYRPRIGRMYMYQYTAKYEDELLYYDKFPLILMVGPAGKNGFYGLNLHYLPYQVRAIFFDKLLDYANNAKFDETTKLKLSYNMLKAATRLRAFAPCFKKYLFNQLESRLAEVQPIDWEMAVFLPTDQFVFQTRQSVWRDSLAQIAGKIKNPQSIHTVRQAVTKPARKV